MQFYKRDLDVSWSERVVPGLSCVCPKLQGDHLCFIAGQTKTKDLDKTRATFESSTKEIGFVSKQVSVQETSSEQ